MRTVLSLTCSLLLFVALTSSAAERGAAAGTARIDERAVRSTLPVEDHPKHRLVQGLSVGRLFTPDRIRGVALDGAEVRFQEQADLGDGAGLVRGYGVWETSTGERLFLVFGYRLPPSLPSDDGARTLEGTFDWVGGTGAFEKVRGKGTLEGEVDAAGRIELRWAGTYEIR